MGSGRGGGQLGLGLMESRKTFPFPNQCVGFSWLFFLFNPGQVRVRIQYERDVGVSKIMTVPLPGIQNPGLFPFLVDSTPAKQGCYAIQLPCFLAALSWGSWRPCTVFPTASSWSRWGRSCPFLSLSWHSSPVSAQHCRKLEGNICSHLHFLTGRAWAFGAFSALCHVELFCFLGQKFQLLSSIIDEEQNSPAPDYPMTL